MPQPKKDGRRYALLRKRGQTAVEYREAAKHWAAQLDEWPLVMNTTELAAILGVRAEALAKWRKEGLGPEWFVLHGCRPMYRKEDVELWMEKMKEDQLKYNEEVIKTQRAAKIKAGQPNEKPKRKGRETIPAHLVFR